MKKLLFFFLCLLIPTFVQASDLILQELTIENGTLSPDFDKYNNEYSVEIEKDIFALDIKYKVEEGNTIAINNNFDLENESIVTITVTKDKKNSDYHLHIMKEEDSEIATFQEVKNEVAKESFMTKYRIVIIPTICLLILISTFKLLFLKSKHKRKII